MSQIKELRSFVTIVAEGSISQAARRLGLPKSTLSRHLKNLEDDTGHALLKRQSNRLFLTEAGDSFLHYSSRILQLADSSREELERLNEVVQGELLLYVDNGLIRGWLGNLIHHFMAQHPKLRITLRSYLSHDTDDWRDAIVLWMGELPSHPLRQECLTLLGQGLYGNRDYFARHGEPQSPQELGKHQWVDLLDTARQQLQLHRADGTCVEVELPEMRLSADQLVLQADAISAGRGIGLMPHWQAHIRINAHPGSFQRCLPDWEAPALPVWLAYPHGKLLRKHRAFINYLRENLPESWQAPLPQ